MEVTSADVEEKLGGMRAVCKILAVIVLVCCLVFAAAALVRVFDVVRGITNVDPRIHADWLQATLLANRVIAATSLSLICFVAFRMLVDVGKASSPFSEVQAKRLLSIALIMVVFTVSISVVYNEAAIKVIVEAANAGGANTALANHWTIPVSYVVTTLFLFILYALFKYGILLQKVSDGTV